MADSVTYAKIQNVSASDRLLARYTSGAGDIEEATLGANMSFSGGALLNTIVAGTAAASTSGTEVAFTGIPSWVKRVTMMLQGVSTNGSNTLLVQIGNGSYTSTGYLGASASIASGVSPSNSTFTTGFGINGGSASNVYHGSVTIERISSGNYVANGMFAASNTGNMFPTAGYLNLGSAIDRIRLTTSGGTDTFDAGSVNILYE